ncbi:hypothetical protein [Candidatus Pelagisphaera phototrophica]|uniref:hypothetical protein n=1 Tax=Candidatus Pelagisphaera phototrophica TaxID=2684113 RepID=UPI001A021DDA|nr:hypothetical protein [Candidatus Pelagisphaera phototrophica]QXD30526.1 hypothetical protein GA004_09025 [Candidatus Pelagisphaera phototrophica]
MLEASGIYLENFDFVALQPSLHSLGHDLGPVVRADAFGCPTLSYRLLQQGQHVEDPDDLPQNADYLLGSASLLRRR